MSDFDHERVSQLTRELLQAIGEDPEREGLEDTPRRVADFWREFMCHDPGRTDTAFETSESGQVVIVSGLRVWSLCEHHLLPFWCDIAIGYVPRGRVLGLSKFARIAKSCARRLQLQERLVADIANAVAQRAGTEDVAVIARGEHLCMTMRGAESPHRMISSKLTGVFVAGEARREFLHVAGHAGGP